MEKEGTTSRPLECVRARSNTGRTKVLLLALIIATGYIYNYGSVWPGNVPDNASLSESLASTQFGRFEWSQLPVSSELRWKPCYERFECARLEVPLDYHDDSAGKAAIALIRYPATIPRNSSDYKGPILFNPGGPGGSGVGLISSWGPKFQKILGPEFDIVGFDPRGVGRTTPVIDIFPGPLERDTWLLHTFDAPLANETNTSFGYIASRAELVNLLIEEKVSIAAQHASTPVVATDMLQIVKAHGMDKLQYWGFSYGTILGSTFASLYPDNVGRIVIDGVMDTEDYYAGTWGSNLKKTDQGLDLVFQQCVEAGDQCALWEPTAERVKERYLRLERAVDERPVVVRTKTYMGIYTSRLVKIALFVALYHPYETMKPLFEAFRELEKGNGVPIYELFAEDIPGPLHCDCGSNPLTPLGGDETLSAILCSDGQVPMKADLDMMYDHFEKLASMSRFADLWSIHRYRCIGKKVESKWKWHGPVTGNTSFPLLLIDNIYDPVTPDAQKVSKSFNNSVVLTQNSGGHCSIAGTSFCTASAIRTYFRDGVLPPKGTTCEVETHMFLRNQKNVFLPSNQEESDIIDALRAMSGKVRVGEQLRPRLLSH
ncbi:alpha/beta-hydrolase [Serendipita vermifera]|nr:alpha/beta-hydrolase [Serendipita vermifera]